MSSGSNLICATVSPLSPAINPLLEDIRQLGVELARRRREFSRHIVSDHNSDRFVNEEVIPFVRGMAKLRDFYRPRIEQTAERISRLGGRGWKKNENIVKLWDGLRQAIQELSEHPDESKKVSAIIVDRDNRMVVWDVNRIPDGFPRDGRYYLKGSRRDLIVCAERNGMARVLGITIPRNARYSIKRKEGFEEQRARAVGFVKTYSKETAQAAQRPTLHRGNSEEQSRLIHRLRGATLFVRAPSCKDCRPAVKAGNFSAVVTDTTAGKHFTRGQELKLGSLGKRTKFIDTKGWQPGPTLSTVNLVIS